MSRRELGCVVSFADLLKSVGEPHLSHKTAVLWFEGCLAPDAPFLQTQVATVADALAHDPAVAPESV